MKIKGFTLIELMVAITILAIIAGIGLTTYSTAQKFSRDSKRKEDLKNLQVALNLYYQTNHHYPIFHHTACGSYIGNGNPDTNTNLDCQIGSTWATSCPPPFDSTFKCITPPGVWITTSNDSSGDALGTDYINSNPVDPLNNHCCNGNTDYIYGYSTTAYTGDPGYPSSKPCPPEGQWYALRARLEDDKDPDAIKNKPVTWCDGTVIDGLHNGSIYWNIWPNDYIVVVTP